MEQVENPMILPQIEYRSQTYFDKMYEAMAEKSDRDYEDIIFEEMNKEED